MKETKIEKLILDLSNRWEVSPEEAVDRLNSMNESEINKLINSMTKKFKNGGFIDCLRNGGSVEKCKCGCDKIAKAAKGTYEDGLTVQTPKNEKDLKWENIKSSFGYGKAAKYITKDGKWQKTEYNYPEATVFGNGNDFTLWVRRDPQTGVVGTAPSDSLVSTKALPFIKLPIRMSGDAPAIRSTVKQEKGGELKRYNSPLPKKSKFKK